jgi:dipeptidyl aminopeptidase/acylaminoacyl peptidase
MRTAAWFLSLALTVNPSSPALAFTQSKLSVEQVLDSLSQLVEFRGVAISPSGARVAWVEAVRGKEGPLPDRSFISIAERHGSKAAVRRISAGAAGQWEEQGMVWSPDGTRLAFFSDAGERHQPQLYLAEIRTGRARRLTHLRGTLADAKWSPDGKRIAFRFIEGVQAKGPLFATARDSGVVQETIHECRIAVVDVASKELRLVSAADLFVYEYDWSPDGSKFVAIGAHGSGDDNWWIAELFTIDAGSGQTQSILKPKKQIAEARWSPDGHSIAFIGGLMSDQGFVGGDVFIVPAIGGEARNLTAEMKASATCLRWKEQDSLLFGERIDGQSGIASVRPKTGEIKALWTAPEHIGSGRFSSGFAVASDGSTFAMVRESFQKPPEVYAGPIGDWTQISHSNERVRPGWGDAQKLHWKSEPFEVQGWLLAPPEVESNRRQPMVVVVHGGPAGATDPFFQPTWGLLASQGYFVLLPNPRGSYGQGEKFTAANVRDFGYGDLKDILAGVEAAVKNAPIDPERVGVFGWSYGGFMVMWAVTQTQRFRAAVAGAGIANWQSYYGQNQIDQWMLPYFGASVYDDPAVYARSSPINFIKQVKTPTLIIQGERDAEVPAPQAYEFWRALKALGVKTQLVVYPDEGHAFLKPEDQRDRSRRIVDWFNQFLDGSS